MKKMILAAMLFAAIGAQAQPPKVPANAGDHFGPVKPTADNAISADQLLSDMKGKAGPVNVKVKAKVVAVCQAMGCWLKVQTGSGDITVRMKDHSFFVPTVLSGKTVIIDGAAEEKVVSVDELKDVAEDAGKSKTEVAKITAPKREVVVQAKGILVL